MLRRWVIGFSLVPWLLTASAQDQPPTCCEPEAETLSKQQVEALVEKTEPILAPCCADMLHIDGTTVSAISVDNVALCFFQRSGTRARRDWASRSGCRAGGQCCRFLLA